MRATPTEPTAITRLVGSFVVFVLFVGVPFCVSTVSPDCGNRYSSAAAPKRMAPSAADIVFSGVVSINQRRYSSRVTLFSGWIRLAMGRSQAHFRPCCNSDAFLGSCSATVAGGRGVAPSAAGQAARARAARAQLGAVRRRRADNAAKIEGYTTSPGASLDGTPACL